MKEAIHEDSIPKCFIYVLQYKHNKNCTCIYIIFNKWFISNYFKKKKTVLHKKNREGCTAIIKKDIFNT